MNHLERAKEVEELIILRNVSRNLEGKKEFVYTAQSIADDYYILKIYLHEDHMRYYQKHHLAQITIVNRTLFTFRYHSFKSVCNYYLFSSQLSNDALDRILTNTRYNTEICASLDKINIYLSELERLIDEIFV